jgi:hypothetical protein
MNISFQDYSAFASESNFDEISWVNSLFKDIAKNQKEVIFFSNMPRLNTLFKFSISFTASSRRSGV